MADPKTYSEQRTKAAQMLMDQGYAKNATSAEFLASNAGRPGFQNSLNKFQNDYNKNPGKSGPLTDVMDMAKVTGALEQKAEQTRQAKVQAEENIVQRREMQGLLTVKGGYSGKIDGSDNEASKAAVTKFQKDNGLDPAKATNAETVAKLRESVRQDPKSVDNMKALGNSGNKDNIIAVEYGLAAHGLPIKPEGRLGFDGKMAPYTAGALDNLAQSQGRKPAAPAATAAPPAATAVTSGTSTAPAAVSAKPDETVKDAQAGLRAFGFTQPEVEGQKKNMLVDGIAGPITHAGILEYKAKYGLDGNAEIKDVVADMKIRIKTEPTVKARVTEVAAQGEGASRQDNKTLARIGNLDPSLTQPVKPATAEPAKPKPESAVAAGPAARTDEQHAKDLGLSATAYEKLKVMEAQWQKDKRSPNGAVGDSPFVQAERIAVSRQQGASVPATGSQSQDPLGNLAAQKVREADARMAATPSPTARAAALAEGTPAPGAQRATPLVQPIVPGTPEQGRSSVRSPITATATQYEGGTRGYAGDRLYQQRSGAYGAVRDPIQTVAAQSYERPARYQGPTDYSETRMTYNRVSTSVDPNAIRETLQARQAYRDAGWDPRAAKQFVAQDRENLLVQQQGMKPSLAKSQVGRESRIADIQENGSDRQQRAYASDMKRDNRQDTADINRFSRQAGQLTRIFSDNNSRNDGQGYGIAAEMGLKAILGGLPGGGGRATADSNRFARDGGYVTRVMMDGNDRNNGNAYGRGVEMATRTVLGGGIPNFNPGRGETYMAPPLQRGAYVGYEPRGIAGGGRQVGPEFEGVSTHGRADPRDALTIVIRERDIMAADRPIVAQNEYAAQGNPDGRRSPTGGSGPGGP